MADPQKRSRREGSSPSNVTHSGVDAPVNSHANVAPLDVSSYGTRDITPNRGLSAIQRSEVDNLIRKKRKQREYKACYPCRSRKVKCDQQVPCKSCVDRQHPEFCTYHPPTEDQHLVKRQDTGVHHEIVENGTDPSTRHVQSPSLVSPSHAVNSVTGTSEDLVTIPKEDLDRLMNQVDSLSKALAEVRNSIRHMNNSAEDESHALDGSEEASEKTRRLLRRDDEDIQNLSTDGVHAHNDLGETIHLGGNSVPALVMELSRRQGEDHEVREMLDNNILPIFGLENETATYPFVSLWNMPATTMSRIQDLARAVPDDAECRATVENYRDHAHVLFPAIANIDRFHQEMLEFLDQRALAVAERDPEAGITDQTLYGKTLYWVGLLFAALACGSQSMPGKRKIQDLASQVFVCCSFECLRLTNFFSHSTLESIQTMLTLGNVISNNMNAGVAWVLLGLTLRLAKGLGLHKRLPDSTPLSDQVVQSQVWWAIIWQDSLLSITYDRASSNSGMRNGPMYPAALQGIQGGWSYEECMYRLCRVGLEVVRDRGTSADPVVIMRRISEQKAELDNITSNAADHLRESRHCKNKRERMQHWCLYMHVSYMTSELSRSTLSPTFPVTELSTLHKQACVQSLVNCVQAFLGLHEVTPFASKSWAAMHRGLSSALLLCILKEPSRNKKARALLEKYVQLLYDLIGDVDASDVAAPIKRSMAALTKLMHAKPGKTGHAVQFSTPRHRPGSIDVARASVSDVTLNSRDVHPQTPTLPTPTALLPDALSMHAASAAAKLNRPLTTSEPDLTDLDMWDSPTLSTMIPLMPNFDQDDSPYTIMDTIIWGQKHNALGV